MFVQLENMRKKMKRKTQKMARNLIAVLAVGMSLGASAADVTITKPYNR